MSRPTLGSQSVALKSWLLVLLETRAGGFLGGDTQVFGFDLEASQYFHLPYDGILLLNGEIAGVNTWGSADEVPATKQGIAFQVRRFELLPGAGQQKK